MWAVALLVRLAAVLLADREVADVALYRRVGEHVLAGGLNPYETRGLYPYPPVWMWVEAAGVWLGRETAVPFAIWIKLPGLAADVLIVALLAAWGRESGLGTRPAWAYALHPVALLITSVHGQFDAIPLACVLLALRWFDGGARDAAALALAAGVATKSFPVLLIPFFLARTRTPREAVRFLILCTAPVVALLAPFAVADFAALKRELLGYSGIADFGWIGLTRGLRWLSTGHLTRSEPSYWGALPAIAKGLFLSSYAVLIAAFWSGRLRLRLAEASLCTFLAFQVFYGAVSAQYLLWVVPLGAKRPNRFLALHAIASAVALVGFYAFLHPGVLGLPDDAGRGSIAGAVWVAGVAAALATGGAWLTAVVREGTRPPTPERA